MPTKKTVRKAAKKTVRKAAQPAKVDLHRSRPEWFRAKRTPEVVRLGAVRYLAIEGKGSPRSKEFPAAVGALYGVAYTIKFTRKFADGSDFRVPTLEAQWWVASSARGAAREPFWAFPESAWRWKLLVMMPDFVRAADVARARRLLALKKRDPRLDRVMLERVREGLCVQALHVGPYDREHDTIERMHETAARRGLRPSGKHHEIYLSDPRRTKPARLRTILRHPVARA